MQWKAFFRRDGAGLLLPHHVQVSDEVQGSARIALLAGCRLGEESFLQLLHPANECVAAAIRGVSAFV